jgi:hypothetical protein
MSMLKKSILVVVALLILGSAVFGGWSQASAAAARATSLTKKVDGGKSFDISVGDGGMSSPNSMYNSKLKVARTIPYIRTVGDMRFINRWIDISVVDDSVTNSRPVVGLVYVYFNLDRQTRPLFDAGELKIYYWDSKNTKWTECAANTLLPAKNDPLGRIACVATRFGRYALATTGKLPQ